MAYIINKPAASETIGLGLGQGLGSAINQMLDQKMRSIQSHHIKNALENLKVPQQEAESIARLYQQSPELAGMFIKSHIDAPGRAAFGRALSGQPEEQQQSQFTQQQPQQMMQQAAPRIPQQTMMALQALQHQDVPQMVQGNPALNQLIATPQQEAWNQALQNYAQEGMLQQQKQKEPHISLPKERNKTHGSTVKNEVIPEKQMKRSESLKAALSTGNFNPQQTKIILDEIKKEEAIELKKEENKRISPAQQKEIDKETLPIYKQTITNAKAARDTKKTLDRMEKLIETGKLSSPLFHSALKTLSHGLWGVGLDLHFLESPESAEFTKLSNSFIKNAKNIFGSRITDQDLKAYMATIPSLLQNDEGKLRVIRNMRIENEAAEIREKIMKDIISNNGGKRPEDLEMKIEEQAAPMLDVLADKFSDGFNASKEEPKGRRRHNKNVLAQIADFISS